MEKEKLEHIHQQLRALQKEISHLKESTPHLEQQRLLKLIDAELMDALYNLEQLLKIQDESRQV